MDTQNFRRSENIDDRRGAIQAPDAFWRLLGFKQTNNGAWTPTTWQRPQYGQLESVPANDLGIQAGYWDIENPIRALMGQR